MDVLLGPLHDVPAFVRDRYLTVVAATPRARALSPAFTPGTNLARHVFLGTADGSVCRISDEVPSIVVGLLHDALLRHPDDAGFRALVGELAVRSMTFARLWAEPGAPVHDAAIVAPWSGGGLTYQELEPLGGDGSVVVVLDSPRTTG